MIYYSRYLMDLCVPWLEKSSPLFERSTSGFCSLINECNKKSATFIECQHFCVLSNFITKRYWSSHNETAASAWQQRNADWWSEMKKTNHNTHHPEHLGWEMHLEFCGIVQLIQFRTFWIQEFLSEFYFSDRKMCSCQV
jgi:hypothetical protein